MSVSDEEGIPEGPPREGVTSVGGRRIHIPDTVARGLLTLLLLGLITWILLSNVSNLEEVGEALAGVSWEAGLLLICLLLVTQTLVAAQLAITVPTLGMRRAVVAVEGAAAVSNTVPGPSGTATTGPTRTIRLVSELVKSQLRAKSSV